MTVRNILIADGESQFAAITGHGWRESGEALIFRCVSWSRVGPQVAEMVVERSEARRLGEWLVAWAKEHEPKESPQ